MAKGENMQCQGQKNMQMLDDSEFRPSSEPRGVFGFDYYFDEKVVCCVRMDYHNFICPM
jgi:hypothetical protein